MYLGIEIGGTKLQLAIGLGDGHLLQLWRGTVDVAAGGDGIRQQILKAVPELIASANVDRSQLRAVGIGFGGPTDDTTQTIIKSHQIHGWDGFPLSSWINDSFKLPAVLGNDADVAGLAEATHGAGEGLSPIFYMTIGSGIGGGLIIDGKIYRGVGRGAAEIGHLQIANPRTGEIAPLEKLASGWAIGARSKRDVSGQMVGELAAKGEVWAVELIDETCDFLAHALCQVIVLLCPKRIVIGGGVSLMGEELLFAPLRRKVNERVFPPFAGLTDIVPASLGEEVVLHGAVVLARQSFPA